MPPKGASRARLMNPTPQDLKDLVLDYLMHNSHTSAARAFMNECGLKRDPDAVPARDNLPFSMTGRPKPVPEADLRLLEERLALGEKRKEIRNHIMTGRIDEATELIKQHFPAVFTETTEDTIIPPSTRRFGFRPPTSVDPTHLALNLRMQAFVEAARTIPLLYTPVGSDTPLPHPPLLSGARLASPGGGEDADMLENDAEQANAQLLHRAQSLYAEVARLPRPTDRAMYLDELGRVGGILAYSVPERSPLSDYMTLSRREAVADQIDRAILYRARKPTISRIELYTRCAGAAWSMLHDKGVPVPPRHKWPAGVSLPPTSVPEPPKAAPAKDSGSLENAIPPPKKANADKDADEVLPPFDLHLFIESQERR
ncbi:hypothetical protein C8Q77DRAFT_1095367 [Trametes polyzona]|nr:hypothetical protein C8Q77DRAFT_1095367 [Trametes polyzona]